MYCNDCGADLDFQRCTCDDKYERERGFWTGRATQSRSGGAARSGRTIGVKASDGVHMPVEATDAAAPSTGESVSETVP